MKKALLFPLLASAVLLGSAAGASAQQLKIGTVDMKKVFDSYYKTKDAESRINEARNQAKKELEDRMEIYKKETDDVTKLNEDINRPELSKDAKESKTKSRDEKIADLKNTEREIREFQQSRGKQLEDQTMRMRAGIVDQIMGVITTRVKADQYDLVFDRSGMSSNAVPVILHAKESYDFTNDIVTLLNKERNSDKSDATNLEPAPAVKPAASSSAAPAATPAKKK